MSLYRGVDPRHSTLRGPIARVEKSVMDEYHHLLPPRVLVPIHEASGWVSQGQTARDVFTANTTVITTTTIEDRRLKSLDWDREFELLKQFGPDYHIPADVSVYDAHSPSEQNERLNYLIDGYLYIRNRIDEERDSFPAYPPVLLPIVKGTTDRQYRKLSYVYAQDDISLVSFYATGYFTGESNGRALVNDVHRVVDQLRDDQQLLLIGCLGSRLLRQMPEQVVAATGLRRWHTIVSGVEDPQTKRDRWSLLSRQVCDALDVSADVSYHPAWKPLTETYASTPELRLSDPNEVTKYDW